MGGFLLPMQEWFSKKKDRTDVGGWVVGRPPQEKKEPTPFFLENIKKGDRTRVLAPEAGIITRGVL